MRTKLSVVIPVYNFAHCLGETLDSITTQIGFDQIKVILYDGASTDDTPILVKNYQKYFPQIGYFRAPQRGGIDRDMANAVSCAETDYCWLFSGDDLMLPGALQLILKKIEFGCDLYLTKHQEWIDYHQEWVTWPTIGVDHERIFELSVKADRYEYFLNAVNTEAFFSFIGGIVVKKSKWDSVLINEKFVGSCWAHVARIFEIMPRGLSVQVLVDSYLKRRPDNDSFASRSVINRFKLTIDGFTKISDHYFGPNSFEAQQVRRVLRNEYHPLNMWLGKFLCLIDPENEDMSLMDHLLQTLYGEHSLSNWRVRLYYSMVTAQRFRRWQPSLSAKYDAIKAAVQSPNG